MTTRCGIDAADGVAEAFVSGSATGGARVLFLVDAIGLRPQIEAMADRIASWGHLVLAPHLFYRHGAVAELAPREPLTTPEARERFFADALPRIASLTTDRAVADLGAYLRALQEVEGVPGPVVCVGYCMGVGLALRAAGAFEEVRGVAGFHGGRLATGSSSSPHLAITPAVRAEVVLGHATDDPSMDAGAIALLGRTLEAAGVRHVQEVYDGPHGFTMADTSSYHEPSAERSFAELRALLERVDGSG